MPEIGPLVRVAEFKDSEWTCEELREETGLERVPLPLYVTRPTFSWGELRY